MLDDRELDEIEACAARGIAFPDGYRRLVAEIRRLRVDGDKLRHKLEIARKRALDAESRATVAERTISFWAKTGGHFDLSSAVNAAELRGQDTGHALAVSTVRAWVKRHEISGSAIDALLAELS